MIKELWFFCAIWSMGCTTTFAGRQKFDTFIRDLAKEKGMTTFPEDKLVYDWNYNIEKLEWESWFDTIREYEVDIKVPYNEIVVPT